MEKWRLFSSYVYLPYMRIDKLTVHLTSFSLLAILFVPLVKTNLFLFPFITGKNFLFRFLVEIAFFAWVFLALRDPVYRPRLSPIMLALAVWILAASLSTFFGVNPFKSFWSNYERMEGLVTFLHLGAFFLALGNLFKKESEWVRFFNLSVLVSGGVSLYALLQWFGLFPTYQSASRLESTLGNSAYLSIYLLFSIGICFILALWAYKKDNIKKIYPYVGLAIFHVFILFLTQTRGTALGLVASFFTALFLFSISEKRTRKLSVGVLAALSLLIVLFVGARQTSFIQGNDILRRFANISFSDTTTASRFTIWKMGWDGFKERPVLGWGPENYTVVFNKYYNPSLWSQEPWFDRAHNVFLDWLVMGGILGLVSYLSLFGAAIFLLYKAKEITSAEKNILTAIGVGYFVHNIFVFDNIASYIFLFIFLAFIYYRTMGNFKPLFSRFNVIKKSETALIFVTVLVVVASVYFFVWRGARASYHLIKALGTSNVEEVLTHFKGTFNPNTFGSPEAVEQLLALTIKAGQSPNLSDEIKKTFKDLAIKETEQAISLYKNNDARQELIYASFLNRMGDSSQAMVHINKARALAPKKQQIMFEEINILLNLGRAGDALAIAEEAYFLDDNNLEARKIYVALLILAGQEKKAEELITKADEFSVDGRVVEAYNIVGKGTAILSILEELEKKYPEEAQLYFLKASLYLNLGNKTDAISALEKGAILNPRLKIEAEDLIKEVKSR